MRATTLDFRPALRVLTSEQVPPGEVVREGEFVLLRIAGVAPEGLALPAVDPPLEGIALERAGALTIIRVKVAPEVPFEASHEPGMLTVVFGELPAPELRGPVTPELYQRLFPAPAQGTEPEHPAERLRAAAGPEGLRLGRATLRPYVSAAWVDADVFAFSSPVPVRDQYLQVGPGVTASMPVGHGAAERRVRGAAALLLGHPGGGRDVAPRRGAARAADRQPDVRCAWATATRARRSRRRSSTPGASTSSTCRASPTTRAGARARRPRGAAVGRGRGPPGPGTASTSSRARASSTTTTARCGPAWATMWAAI